MFCILTLVMGQNPLSLQDSDSHCRRFATELDETLQFKRKSWLGLFCTIFVSILVTVFKGRHGRPLSVTPVLNRGTNKGKVLWMEDALKGLETLVEWLRPLAQTKAWEYCVVWKLGDDPSRYFPFFICIPKVHFSFSFFFNTIFSCFNLLCSVAIALFFVFSGSSNG